MAQNLYLIDDGEFAASYQLMDYDDADVYDYNAKLFELNTASIMNLSDLHWMSKTHALISTLINVLIFVLYASGY